MHRIGQSGILFDSGVFCLERVGVLAASGKIVDRLYDSLAPMYGIAGLRPQIGSATLRLLFAISDLNLSLVDILFQLVHLTDQLTFGDSIETIFNRHELL